jgi:hypothetical protein
LARSADPAEDSPVSVRAFARLLAALVLGLGLGVSSGSTPAPIQAADLPRWTGSIDLYRSGSFSTQKTYLWCTAADVQMARNIVTGQGDHGRASQERYFYWMRARNRYDIPLKDGVDPQGWAAGMRQFVDARYRLVTFGSFNAAVHSAATSIRLTDRPVGIIVANGEHAWLMTGFNATADPAQSDRFAVTSVRVVGPLYGLQSRNGYDMPPDTRLSVSSLRQFFTPFDDAYVRMIWKGLYVTIQAVPDRDPGVAAHALHPAQPMTPRATPTRLEAGSAQAASPPQPSASGTGPATAVGRDSPGSSRSASTVDAVLAVPLLALFGAAGAAGGLLLGTIVRARRR